MLGRLPDCPWWPPPRGRSPRRFPCSSRPWWFCRARFRCRTRRWPARPPCAAGFAARTRPGLPRDAVALGHHVGGVDHFHEQRGLVLHQPGVEVRCRRCGLRVHQRNAFHPPATMAGTPSSTMRPAHGNGLQARRAEAVDDRAAHGDGAGLRSAVWRPMLRPVVPSGVAAAPDQGLRSAGVNARALHGSLTEAPAGAGVWLNSPRCDLVSGVRAVETMTASRMAGSWVNSCFCLLIAAGA